MRIGSNKTTEVFVIGGGPSGSAFAITAARAGLQVVLCERTTVAHHKVCGEFLSHETQALLSKLGVDVKKHSNSKQEQIRLISDNRYVDSKLPFTGISLSRKKLDALLLNEAMKAGVTVLRGVYATHLDERENLQSAIISLSKGGNYQAKIVALAVGSSTVRGIAPRILSPMVGYKIVLSLSPSAQSELKDRVQLLGYDKGYQGMLLDEENRASLAWLMDAERAKTLSSDWNKHRDFLSSQSALVGDLLENSATDWVKPITVSGLEFGFIRESVIGENIFPVGRQMAIIPSFTGDGIAVALASGIEAAQMMIKGAGAQAYQTQMRRKLINQFRVAKAIHPLFMRSWTRSFAMRITSAVPGIIPFLANATRLHHLP